MSRKNLPCLCTAVVFLLVSVLLPAVAPAVHAADSDLFIAKCGHCHHLHGKADPINPSDKAGLVWIKYFKRQRHPVDLAPRITTAEMKQILIYLQEHAADSERPIAAVIPK